MLMRCYFDMLDNCVGYDYAGFSTGFECTGVHAPIISAIYDLPSDIKPMNETAETLHGWQVPV